MAALGGRAHLPFLEACSCPFLGRQKQSDPDPEDNSLRRQETSAYNKGSRAPFAAFPSYKGVAVRVGVPSCCYSVPFPLLVVLLEQI